MTGPIDETERRRDACRHGAAGTTAITAAEVTAESWPRAERSCADGFRLALMAAHEDADRIPRRLPVRRAAHPTAGSSWCLCTDRSAPASPAWPRSPSPPAGSSGRCETSTASPPLDHPLPRRLVRHHHWPQGWYPMRADAGPPPPFGSTDEPYPFLTVDGPASTRSPSGPIHAGLIEPGHFRLSVVGETILKLKARLWFVHKGIEKLAEGRLLADVAAAGRAGLRRHRRRAHPRVLPRRRGGPGLAGPGPGEQYCGRRSWSWSGSTTTSPTSARCATTSGTAFLNAHALRVRERLLRLNARRHRPPAAAGRDLPRRGARARRAPTAAELAEIAADVAEIVDLALGHSVVHDRFTGTAILTAEQVADIGVRSATPPAPAASTIDARRDHPFTDATAGLSGRHPDRGRRAGPVPGPRRGGPDLGRPARAAARAGRSRRDRQPQAHLDGAGLLRSGPGRRLARHHRAPRRDQPGQAASAGSRSSTRRS